MSQIIEMQSIVEEYLQQRIKNAVVSCVIVSNDHTQETLLAAIAIITFVYGEEIYRASEQTAWHRSLRFTLDEISDELDYTARSLVCRLGFAIFGIKETE